MKNTIVLFAAIALLCLGGMAQANTVVYQDNFDTEVGKGLVADLGWVNIPGYGDSDLTITNSTNFSSPAIDGSTATGPAFLSKSFTRLATATGYVLTGNMDVQGADSHFGFGFDNTPYVYWSLYGTTGWVFSAPGYMQWGSGSDYSGIVELEIEVDEVNNLTRGKLETGSFAIDTDWKPYLYAPVSAVVIGSSDTFNSMDDIVVTAMTPQAVPELPPAILASFGLPMLMVGMRKLKALRK